MYLPELLQTQQLPKTLCQDDVPSTRLHQRAEDTGMPTTPFLWGGNGLSVQSSVGGQRHHFSGGRYGLSVQSSVRMTREVEFFLDLPMLRPWGAQHFKLVSFSLVVTVLRSEVTSPTGTWAAGSVGEGCGGWRGETVSRVIWRGETVSRVICYCCLAIHTQGLRNLGVYGR